MDVAQLTRGSGLNAWKPSNRPRTDAAPTVEQPAQRVISAAHTAAPTDQPGETTMKEEHRTTILGALEDGPLKPAQLVKATKLTKYLLTAALKQLVQEKAVVIAGKTSGRLIGLPGQDLGVAPPQGRKAKKKAARTAHSRPAAPAPAIRENGAAPRFAIDHLGHFAIAHADQKIELLPAEFKQLRDFIDNCASIFE